jgi:response regulator RpfG family c-di-GMP phosphodiesterase
MENPPSAEAAREAAKNRFRARHAGDPAHRFLGGGGSRPAPPRAPSGGGLAPEARAFLDKLLTLDLLDGAAAEAFVAARADRLTEYTGAERLGAALVQAGLLTDYQLDRVLGGLRHGLVLGSYRVLDGLGSGGMGVVFVAERRLMKRRAAVKVLPVDEDCPASVRQRFYSEMRVLAELCHPNVVLAFDAGEVRPADPTLPELMYLVMELVEGGDLERHVLWHGPCDVARACDYIRQAASGLLAAHDRHLVHRDLKPFNLLLTNFDQVKLVDFGLARQFCSRLTDLRALLGSVEFMAPEQSHDPSGVGKEADVDGLGATLFWLLTGEAPYPFARSVGAALQALQQEPPRHLRHLRPEAPEELEVLLDRMLDRNPARRPPSPVSVMNALVPFVETEVRPRGRGAAAGEPAPAHRALLVDDDGNVRRMERVVLESLGCACEEAEDGAGGLARASAGHFDLLLLDLKLPDADGYEVCRRVRESANNPHLKIFIVSGAGDHNELSAALPRGADDYIVKPFEPQQLAAKAAHALCLKDAQDRAALLADQLREANRQLQQSLDARGADVRRAHNALLFTMAKMAESRDGETPGHLRRLQCYSQVLAREAADIGKLGLPDDVLLKPAALSAAERLLMEQHPVIGDRILESLGREHGSSLEFLGMARAIVRHHHERFDGRGYPDRLAGDAIPAAARLVAVADVYDALRRERQHKPAMSHADAVRVLRGSEGQFDPTLVAALERCQKEWEHIYADIA